jgi:hypothetical protein
MLSTVIALADLHYRGSPGCVLPNDLSISRVEYESLNISLQTSWANLDIQTSFVVEFFFFAS